jgi:serine/threonine protein kinase/tetratricopeptide (TPR) repeat protein
MMTPERWQRVKELLGPALELDAAKRAAYLDRACENDPTIRPDVESLLAAEQKAGADFLNDLILPNEISAALSLRDDHWIGRRLGPYQIAKEIGAGGMGEVYRAVRADDEYRKEVAIKLVRSGQDSRFVLSRFKKERQILASLDHPNIARLIDGGTTQEGVPYFVMELIEGERINKYCDERKLSTTERLALFLQVCSAVQYAHQHLVIHRDIKPGNILVNAEGVPKLLDFGIAKILGSNEAADQPEQTISLIRLLTPEYASPEQVRSETITTASDVYSLGVVLYELLTGRTPYNVPAHSPHEISRAVCEAEPEKPSVAARRKQSLTGNTERERPDGSDPSLVREGAPERLSKRLSGDLDNIALMALRKEPQRRYASVEQFAQDIRRHLDHFPVVARKDTFGYRTSKFIARHKGGVALAALITVALLSATGVTLRQARIARVERTRAERRFNDVRALANSLMFEIHDGISRLPGSTPIRELLVNRALQYLDSLSQEASSDPSLQRELAAAYDRVGDLQGNTGFANQGNSAGALQSYRKAMAIRESLVAVKPGDPNLQTELSDEYFRMANSLEAIGDFPGSLTLLRKALPMTERTAASTNNPKIRDRQAGTYYFIAGLLDETGDSTGALENYRKAATIHQAITTTDQHENMDVRTHLAGDYAGMAQVMMVTGDFNQALQEQGEALQILKELSSANPTDAALREYLAESYNLSGTLWRHLGDQSKALENHRQAHQIFKELVTADPANFLAKDNFGFSAESMGEILVARGDIVGGLQNIREGLAAFQAMANAGSKDRYVQSGLAESYFALGSAYSALAVNAKGSVARKTSSWREARAWYQKSSDIWAEKRTHASLDRLERETAERTVQGIVKCDAALTKPTATGRK